MKHEYTITIDCTCGYNATIRDEKEGPGGPDDVGDVEHRVMPQREGILGSIGLEDKNMVTITHCCSCGFTATTINACPGSSSISHFDVGEEPDLSFVTHCKHVGEEENCRARQPSTIEGGTCYFQVPGSGELFCGNRYYGWLVGWWLD